MRALLLLLTAWIVSCTAPEREPIAVQRGREVRSVAPAETDGAAGSGALEPGTVGLLERLLAEQRDPAGGDVDERAPDERALCLDLGFAAGLGPFRNDGHDLPPAAAEAALSDALEASFAEGGPLAGPLAIPWEALFHPDDEGLPAVLDPPLPARVLERARALGGAYLLAGRLERLEHERVSVYSTLHERFEHRERGRLRLWYQLYELEYGSLLCSDPIDRRYSLDELTPAELASAEQFLARLAADEIRTAIEACLGGEAPVR